MLCDNENKFVLTLHIRSVALSVIYEPQKRPGEIAIKLWDGLEEKMRKFLLLTCALSISLPSITPAYADENGIMSGSVGIFACDAPGDKQKKGAVIGAVLGGVIANKVAKDNKTLATVIGAAVGGAVGSYYGCTLQRKDQEKMAADSERAMALGETVRYTNDETGMNVETKASSTVSTASQELIVAKNVVAPKGLILIGSKYVAIKDTSMKTSTTSKAKVISKIAANTEVEVLGQTSLTDGFAAIRANGVLAGYVPMKDLQPLGKLIVPNSQTAKNFKTVKVPITSTCREVTQTIDFKGEISENGRATRQACVGTDGVWKTI